MIKAKRAILILLCLNVSLATFGQRQTTTITVSGTVKDSKSQTPLERVNVSIEGTANGAITDDKGNYSLNFRSKKKLETTLIFSFVGYSTTKQTLKLDASAGVYELNVHLDKFSTVLPTVDISATNLPDTVFSSNQFSIADYEFLDRGFAFLTYEKRLEKGASIVITDENQKIKTSIKVPCIAKNLYQDYVGKIHCICEEAIYRITADKGEYALIELQKKDFELLNMPCVDTLGGQVVFNDFQWYYPRFSYYYYNPYDSSAVTVKEVMDKELLHMYRMEYHFMKPSDRLVARRFALQNKMDKKDVAAIMNNFHNSIYYEPLYAPLYVVNDTTMIFDHYESKLYKFDEYANAIDSVPINYHHPKKQKDWKTMLFKDEWNDEIYTLYDHNGHPNLKHINVQNGNIDGEFELLHRWVEKIKIKDDYAYYIYRPYDSIQKKFLYKQQIRLE